MRILQQGTSNQVKCTRCGSLLQFERGDVRLVHSPIQVGHHEIECMPEAEDHYRAVVDCPSCRTVLSVTLSRQEKRALMPALYSGPYDG
jgi:ribosomal protein S27E